MCAKHTRTYGQKHRAISAAAAGLIIVLILVVAASAYVWYPPQQSVKTQTVSQTGTYTAPAGNVAGKIQFVITNILTGATASPSSFKIYPAAGSTVAGVTYGGKTASETVAISSGTGTTGDVYAPGTLLNVYGLLSGSATTWWQVTAPGVTQAQAGYGTAAQLGLAMVTTPTYSMSVTDDKGNVYATGKAINFTNTDNDADTCAIDFASLGYCVGETSVSLTMTITNTAANTGFLSSYDPLNNQNWCQAMVITESGTDANEISVSGFPSAYGSYTTGTVRHWMTALPDGYQASAYNPIAPNTFADQSCAAYSTATGGISVQTQGSQNVGGSVVIHFTITQNGQDVGDTQTLSFQPWLYFDLANAFNNGGNGGATAATSGSPYTLVIDS
jgi:hypothetical protein